MKDVEEKYFDVDYKGWIRKKSRKFEDVRGLFYGDARRLFDHWAKEALYGSKIIINGIKIEHIVPEFEIHERCRYYIKF